MNLPLADLEPEFVQRIIKNEDVLTTNGLVRRDVEYHRHVSTLAEAQGVMFLCPSCFVKNNGPIGTHSVLCWFKDKGIPDDALPKPGRWTPSGTGLTDLSLTPSVDLSSNGDGEWHGFITGGVIT